MGPKKWFSSVVPGARLAVSESPGTLVKLQTLRSLV